MKKEFRLLSTFYHCGGARLLDIPPDRDAEIRAACHRIILQMSDEHCIDRQWAEKICKSFRLASSRQTGNIGENGPTPQQDAGKANSTQSRDNKTSGTPPFTSKPATAVQSDRPDPRLLFDAGMESLAFTSRK